MKKTLLAILAVSLFVYSANAQIKKGSVFLGGDISGSTQKTKSNDVITNKQSGINILPVFGKAIKDNLVLGINAGFGIYDNEHPTGDNTNFDANSYNVGVFLRKYKNVGTSGFYLFVQGGLGAHYMIQKQEGGSYLPSFDELKRTSIGLSAYPGLSYAVSKKLHLETGFNNLLSMNYFHEKRQASNPGSITKTNGFSVASSLNNATSALYLGFRLLLGK